VDLYTLPTVYSISIST